MKNFIIVTCLSGLVFFIGYFIDMSSIPEVMHTDYAESISVNVPLPKFNFKTVDGKKFDIYSEEFKDKVIILNFWASWCGPCVEEFPEMIQLIEKYHEDVVLVAISNDSAKKDILKFLKDFKKFDKTINSKSIYIGWDKSRDIALGYFDVVRLPESFIINKKKMIVSKVVGAQDWKNGSVDKAISKLLKNK